MRPTEQGRSGHFVRGAGAAEAGGGVFGRGMSGALRIAAALAAAAVCWFAFAVWLPTDARRYADFADARPCAAGVEVAQRADCLLAVPATVGRVTARDTPGSRVWLTPSATPSGLLGIKFKDSGPLLYRLRPGDQVTVTFWRGEAVGLEKDGLRLKTDAAPRDEGQITAAIGTFAGLLAVLALSTGTSSLRSAGHPRAHRLGRLSAAKPLILVAMLASAAAAAATLLLDAPWWTVPVVATPTVAAATEALYRVRLREGRWPVRRF
ncbi:hypothetical protein [Streptomyces sp. NBC_00503]|uniref:hypothetical protein n=1 Tax=Streptomyces sp. NBC_00503 TaxID=2903659 RepID=UPI002E80EE55|nr:hypothetical protein [Streptomyces sp. NBC_00503]WUD81946.1 hypothetical protein OG490_16130 [Streptomyces sp. NBC_00503]